MVHFQELSPDFRVPDDLFVSLPELRSMRGDATTLRHFIPLLRDVSWDSFWEIDIDTNISGGPGDSVCPYVGLSVRALRFSGS